MTIISQHCHTTFYIHLGLRVLWYPDIYAIYLLLDKPFRNISLLRRKPLALLLIPGRPCSLHVCPPICTSRRMDSVIWYLYIFFQLSTENNAWSCGVDYHHIFASRTQGMEIYTPPSAFISHIRDQISCRPFSLAKIAQR